MGEGKFKAYRVGLGWVGLGWVGLGWVGLGWVGLGWWGVDTLKSGVLKTATHLAPMARSVQPTVASAKSPLATSLATLAPMSTDMSTSGALGPW